MEKCMRTSWPACHIYIYHSKGCGDVGWENAKVLILVLLDVNEEHVYNFIIIYSNIVSKNI